MWQSLRKLQAVNLKRVQEQDELSKEPDDGQFPPFSFVYT